MRKRKIRVSFKNRIKRVRNIKNLSKPLILSTIRPSKIKKIPQKQRCLKMNLKVFRMMSVQY